MAGAFPLDVFGVVQAAPAAARGRDRACRRRMLGRGFRVPDSVGAGTHPLDPQFSSKHAQQQPDSPNQVPALIVCCRTSKQVVHGCHVVLRTLYGQFAETWVRDPRTPRRWGLLLSSRPFAWLGFAYRVPVWGPCQRSACCVAAAHHGIQRLAT